MSNRIALVSLVFVFGVLPLLGGARCNNADEPLDTVRDVHTDVRAAFIAADNIIAPRLEDAGLQCEEEVLADGLMDQEAMTAWRECMQSWMVAEQAMAMSREILAQLEDVYEDIEAGELADDDFQLTFLFRQLVSHGRSLVRAVQAIDAIRNTPNIREVIDGIDVALNQLCAIIDCER